MMIATQDAATTNSESLADDSFDMMITTQDALHGLDSGFDSLHDANRGALSFFHRP